MFAKPSYGECGPQPAYRTKDNEPSSVLKTILNEKQVRTVHHEMIHYSPGHSSFLVSKDEGEWPIKQKEYQRALCPMHHSSAARSPQYLIV